MRRGRRASERICRSARWRRRGAGAGRADFSAFGFFLFRPRRRRRRRFFFAGAAGAAAAFGFFGGFVAARSAGGAFAGRVVLVVVVDVEVVCAAAFSALVSLGGVMFGRALGDRVGDAAAAAAGARACSAHSGDQRRRALRRRRAALNGLPCAMPSGPMRRPQVGQSLRSFWASWSHQLQKRRFSTAHGRLRAPRGPAEAPCRRLPAARRFRGRGRSRQARPRARSRARWRGFAGDSAGRCSRGETLSERPTGPARTRGGAR